MLGIVLILALLTVGPAIARLFTYNLKKMMLLSIILGIVFCFAGLWASYVMQIATGASIVIVSFTTYLLANVWQALRKGITGSVSDHNPCGAARRVQ